MAGKGGYQAPNNPASVSGIGAASARTDGRPGEVPPPTYRSPAYGEGAALQAASQAIPDTAGPSAPTNMSAFSDDPNLDAEIGDEDFSRETERPDEDISHGASFGDTPGRVNNSVDAEYMLANQTKAAMLLGLLNRAVQNGNPTEATVALYRKMRAELGTPGVDA